MGRAARGRIGALQTRDKSERTGRRTGVIDMARILRDSGQWSSLASYLAEHPVASPAAELEIIRAEAAMRTGDTHTTVEIVDRTLEDEERLPHATRAYALLVRSMASRLRGFSQKALEDASAATAILEERTSPAELIVQGHKQIGIGLASTGDLERAVEHFERALRHCARTSNLRLQAEIQNALGLTCFRLGRLPEAQVHYKNAAAAYRKLDSPAELSDLYINIGLLHFNLGEHDQALELYQRALELARAASYHRSVSMALVNIGDVRQVLGNYDDAIKSYEEALQSGADALEPRLFCCANTGLGEVFRALKNGRRARFYLEQATFEARRLGLKHELATACTVEARLCLDEGANQRAREVAEEGVRVFEEIGAIRPLVRACLVLALANLRARRWKSLSDALEALARAARKVDSADYLLQEARAAREVIDFAASKRVGGTLFREIRWRLRDRTPSPAAVIRRNAGHEFDRAGLPQVETRLLGGFRVSVDGRKVAPGEWDSQKAQELFAFLLCNRSGRSREELIEVLWPDTAVGLSRNAFHNNVYRCRRALYRACVVLDEGRYRLNPSGSFNTDLEEFRKLHRKSEEARRPAEAIALLERAVRLYRGPFLPALDAEWITSIRAETEAAYMGSLERMARLLASSGELLPAVAALDRALRIDPTEVETQEQIVTLLVRAGKLAEARKRHESFSRLACGDSGTTPPRDFAALCSLASAD